MPGYKTFQYTPALVSPGHTSAYTGIGSGKPAYQVFTVKITVKISNGKPAYQISYQESTCMKNVLKFSKTR